MSRRFHNKRLFGRRFKSAGQNNHSILVPGSVQLSRGDWQDQFPKKGTAVFRDDTIISDDYMQNAAYATLFARRIGRVKDAINLWLALALGEGTLISCENQDVEQAARDFAKSIGFDRWNYHQIRQMLIKGDCIGFRHRNDDGTVARLQVVNPLSITVDYAEGEVAGITQKIDKQTLPLSLDDTIFVKWDAPDFEERGTTMILAAFDEIADLLRLKHTDRIIDERYREPLVHGRYGGERAKKYYRGEDRTIENLANKFDKSKGKVLFTDDLLKFDVVGAEMKVPDNEKKLDRIENAISLAMGIPRAWSSGDGPNRETARAAVEKVQTQVGLIRACARELSDWVFGDWMDTEGYSENLSYGRISTDPEIDTDQASIMSESVRYGQISLKTYHEFLHIDSDSEAARLHDEAHELSAEQLLKAVQLGIVERDEAREHFGLGQSIQAADDAALSTEADIVALYARCGVPMAASHHPHTITLAAAETALDTIYTPTLDDMSAALKTASDRVQAELEKLAKKDLTKSDTLRKEVLDGLDAKFNKLEAELTADLHARVPVAVESSVEGGVQAGLTNLVEQGVADLADLNKAQFGKKVKDTFALVDTAAIEALKTQQLQLMGSVSQELMSTIYQEITAGILEGASIDKVSRRIGKYIDDPEAFRKAGKSTFKTAQQRVRTIVRTETMEAHNTGRKDSYKQMGVTQVRWMTFDPCPICEPLGGAIFGIDELPRLPRHPNCKCTISAVVEPPEEEVE